MRRKCRRSKNDTYTFGLDEFSMSPISILPARKLITSLSYADMQKFADEVLAMGTAKEIKEYVDKTFNM